MALSSNTTSSKLVWEYLEQLNNLGTTLAKKAATTSFVGPELVCNIRVRTYEKELKDREEKLRPFLWENPPGMRHSKVSLGNFRHCYLEEHITRIGPAHLTSNLSAITEIHTNDLGKDEEEILSLKPSKLLQLIKAVRLDEEL
ncbi:hypothetical protein Trydic_g18087 [Trypoxylus dichotomus]